MVTGRSEASLRETADAIEGRYFVMDVRDPASAKAVADQLDELTVLVNCAGVFREESVFDVTPESYRETMDTNVGGILFTTQAFRSLITTSQGAIVNVTSIGAKVPSPSLGVYSASKAASATLTELLALEFGPLGVRVNAVAPGNTHTESNGIPLRAGEKPKSSNYIPLRRMAVPDDMANAVAFLVSDEAAYITGQTITVDGGLSIGSSVYYRAANAGV